MNRAHPPHKRPVSKVIRVGSSVIVYTLLTAALVAAAMVLLASFAGLRELWQALYG